MQKNKPLSLVLSPVIAHRGAPRFAPENTLEALEAAKNYGAQWVEFDVTMTADGVVIVFHDEVLERTTNGSGNINQKSFSELQSLSAGGWFSAHFAHCKIPTFEEYIRLAAQLGVAINVEIKTSVSEIRTLVKKVLSLLKKYWPSSAPIPLISSFSLSILQALRQERTLYPIALNVAHWGLDQITFAKKLRCYSIHCDVDQLTPEIITIITQNGFKALAYTVNDAAYARHLFRLGVSAIFSDIPNLLEIAF